MKLSIIIPVFNEEKTIEKIILSIFGLQLSDCNKKIGKEIIVVDDGSVDKTQNIISFLNNKLNFIFLKHSKNKGKGAAIKTALQKARGDFVIIQDADLEYDPKEYKLLLNAIDDEHQVVYGSRNLGKAKRGYFLFFLSGKLLSFFCSLLYGAKITDINTCYKLFRADIIKEINLESNGFEFCEEVTIKILRKGYKIKEVPIHYYPRSFKEGKKIKFKDGVIALWTIIKNRF